MSLLNNLLFFSAGYYIGSTSGFALKIDEFGISIGKCQIVKDKGSKYIIANIYEIKKIK